MTGHVVAIVHELEHQAADTDLVAWAATCTCGTTAYGFPTLHAAEQWATRTHAQPASIPNPTDTPEPRR